MIKSVRVKSLFNRYNYQFDFSKDNITIIAGPNGYGKTTVLNAIRDVLDDGLYHLSSIIFEEFELTTHDNKTLLFSKNDGNLFINGQRLYIPESINVDSRGTVIFTIKPKDINDLRTRYKKFYPPQQVLTVIRLQCDGVEGYTMDNLLKVNYQLLGEEIRPIIKQLLEFYDSVGNSIYCSADRLYHDFEINDGSNLKAKEYKEVIKSLPEKLNSIFTQYNNEYARLSSNLDFTFVSKLSEEIKKNTEDNEGYTAKDFNSDMEIINKRLDKLISYGFLYRETLYNKKLTFNADYKYVFKIFTNNYIKKLDSLESLIDKLDLFLKIINSKLNNKKIVLKNSLAGVETIMVFDDDVSIPLDSLSSGEKEIIVMYYKLIFDDTKQLIALVDEPELSTHVAWQYEAIDDFEQIMKVNKSLKQMIICTHSPQIIGEHWDKTIDLFNIAK